MDIVQVGRYFEVGPGRPFLLLAGPCVLESEELALEVAGRLKEIAGRLGISYVFKASFDKANPFSKPGPRKEPREVRKRGWR